MHHPPASRTAAAGGSAAAAAGSTGRGCQAGGVNAKLQIKHLKKKRWEGAGRPCGRCQVSPPAAPGRRARFQAGHTQPLSAQTCPTSAEESTQHAMQIATA